MLTRNLIILFLKQIDGAAFKNSLALGLVDQHVYDITEKSELENGTISQGEAVVDTSKKLQDALKKKHLMLKKHEDNIKYFKTREYSLNDTILDLQVTFGEYLSLDGPIIERGELSK